MTQKHIVRCFDPTGEGMQKTALAAIAIAAREVGSKPPFDADPETVVTAQMNALMAAVNLARYLDISPEELRKRLDMLIEDNWSQFEPAMSSVETTSHKITAEDFKND